MANRPRADRHRLRLGRGMAVGAIAVVLTAGCAPPPPEASPSVVATTPARSSTAARELATGLDVPWDLAELPDGNVLVTLRDRAEVVRVTPQGEVELVGRIAEVAASGEGGLLGLAISPQFADDSLIYLYYSAARENRVVRYRYTPTALTDPEVIFDGIPRAANHNGGRLRFGPDGYLYVGTGDAGRGELAQDLGSPAGKILRLAADGTIPTDNPFGSAVYSYGHRNVQGLGWDGDGRMYASEFGQNTFDELNLIQPGGNYGWPQAEGTSREQGLVSPLLVWRPAEASPSGIAVTASGTVYVAALRGERVWRTSRDGSEMRDPEVFLDGVGRVRAVELLDEELLVLTNNTARGSAGPKDDRLIAVPLR